MLAMDGIYGAEPKALNLTDFHVPISVDDDSSVLLSNTNKLLSAVGISAKKISTTDELSRVASSLIVAVFESLFHQRVDGVIRNPRSKEDYEKNAQLIIDSLSDQIQVDLKHITGRSIVSGDLRVLSNLVHILVRIVSLTSQESLTSYDSSEHIGGMNTNGLNFRGARNINMNMNRFRDRVGREEDSISTRQSEEVTAPPGGTRDPYYLTGTAAAAAGAHARGNDSGMGMFGQNMMYEGDAQAFNVPEGILFNDDLKRSLAKADKLLQLESKIEAARKRRENALFLRESASRAANLRHAEISRDAMQQKWQQDADRARQAFELRRANDDQVVLRKIYKGLLKKVMWWKVDEAREVRAKSKQVKEQTAWHIESLQQLFEERLQVLAKDDADLLRSRKTSYERDELVMAGDLVRSVESRNRALLSKETARLQERRDRELLRRQEAHKNLLAMLSVSGWQDMLRETSSN